MGFEVLYDPHALEDLKNLDKSTLLRIKHTIESRLVVVPMEFGKPLRYTAQGLWSLRVGDWRVIYKILGKQVWIVRIGHRREVYSIFRGAHKEVIFLCLSIATPI